MRQFSLATRIVSVATAVFSIVHAASWQRYHSISLGPRQEHAVAVLNSSVYIIGGVRYDYNSSLLSVNYVEVFDANTNFWSVAAPLPVPVNHANAAGVDGKVYVLGAMGVPSPTAWEAIGNVWFYSPQNDTWTASTSMPNGTWRGASAVGIYGSKIYLAGGMTYTYLNVSGGLQDAVSMVSSYDTHSGVWDTSLPDLPAPRQHVGGAVVGNTFYVLGGREGGNSLVRRDVYALDLSNVTSGWKTLSPMPTARGGLACAALSSNSTGGEIYCMGGENPDIPPFGIYDNNEVYDTASDTWQELEPMSVPRHGTGAAGVNGKVYIPGGGTLTGAGPVGIVDAYVP